MQAFAVLRFACCLVTPSTDAPRPAREMRFTCSCGAGTCIARSAGGGDTRGTACIAPTACRGILLLPCMCADVKAEASLPTLQTKVN
jgi:hypothetical protein